MLIRGIQKEAQRKAKSFHPVHAVVPKYSSAHGKAGKAGRLTYKSGRPAAVRQEPLAGNLLLPAFNSGSSYSEQSTSL